MYIYIYILFIIQTCVYIYIYTNHVCCFGFGTSFVVTMICFDQSLVCCFGLSNRSFCRAPLVPLRELDGRQSSSQLTPPPGQQPGNDLPTKIIPTKIC